MTPLPKALAFIKKYKSFLVTTHHNPDADAVGSALGMAILLKALGKKVRVLNEDPLPAWLHFLPQAKMFEHVKHVKPFAYDAAIILDCGDFERIGGVSQHITKQTPVLNIDHHVTNEGFGHVNAVLSKASSTSEIVYQLFGLAKIAVSKQAAILLYSGIMTDTGSFRFENTAASTFEAAADLVRRGVDVPAMYAALYPGVPVADMPHFTRLIYSSELLYQKKVYCVLLPLTQLKNFSKGFDLKEKIFSFLRSVEGIEVVVILNELPKGEVRVNFRSQGDVDVSRLAQNFHGGGHRRAAGAKLEGSLGSVKKKVLSAVRRALKG